MLALLGGVCVPICKKKLFETIDSIKVQLGPMGIIFFTGVKNSAQNVLMQKGFPKKGKPTGDGLSGGFSVISNGESPSLIIVDNPSSKHQLTWLKHSNSCHEVHLHISVREYKIYIYIYTCSMYGLKHIKNALTHMYTSILQMYVYKSKYIYV